MNILVVGGAGFIGSHLVEKLLENYSNADEHHISIVDDLSTGSLKNIEHLDCFSHDNFKPNKNYSNSTFHKEKINDYIKDRPNVRFDYVFSLAAQISVPETVEDPIGSNLKNVTETLEFVDWVFTKCKPKKFIWFSSSAVYGDNVSVKENQPFKNSTVSPYAIQKKLMEDYIEFYSNRYKIQSLVFRPFNVFGTRQNPDGKYPNLISSWGKALATNQPLTIYGSGEQKRDFVSVKQLVEKVLSDVSVTDYPAFTIKDIGTGFNFSVNEVLSLVRSEIDSYLLVKFFPERLGEVKETLSATKLDYSLNKLKTRKEIVDTLEWYMINYAVS